MGEGCGVGKLFTYNEWLLIMALSLDQPNGSFISEGGGLGWGGAMHTPQTKDSSLRFHVHRKENQ